jgi:Caspase domain
MPVPFAEDPALVHHVDVNVPGTHVIAIGIGHYDHLEGGGKPLTRHHLDLKQLTSPPISATKIAAWFIEEFDCPDSPLASVSLVLSEPQPAEFRNGKTGQTFKVPTGTMDEVRTALSAWMKRAETDPRNRIILYFSGHGLSEGIGLEQKYLLRDYGKDANDPLLGALDYQTFISGLATRRPSSQFLLFDACRVSEPIAKWNPTGGERIFAALPEERLGITQPMRQCPIFSAEIDRPALGRPNEESLCAKAFIRAMRGACCKREGNSWYVTTERILDTLSDFQNREALEGNAKQSADANRHAKIHLRRLNGIPSIPVFVRLDVKALAPDVIISAIRGIKASQTPQTISDPNSSGWQAREEWETELEIGEYRFQAVPLKPGKEPITCDDTVMPSHTEVTLEVSRWGL